jgi:hypothetical protein
MEMEPVMQASPGRWERKSKPSAREQDEQHDSSSEYQDEEESEAETLAQSKKSTRSKFCPLAFEIPPD